MAVGGARKYRVTELDRLYTGKPLLTALGPVDFTDDGQIADALDRIASDGPYTRVGLQSTAASRRWRVLDHPGSVAVLPACPNPCKNMTEVMASMERVRPETPVAFWRCGEYLCCYFDHGVADAFVIMRVLDALTAHAPEPGVQLSGKKISRRPLARALWTGVRHQPRLLASGVGDLVKAATSRLRPRGDAGEETVEDTVPALANDEFSPDELTFVFLSTSPDYLRQLRNYRDAVHPGVTTTSLVALWMCQELAAAGVKLADRVQFTTDLRRFLPPDRITHNNFIGVMDVPFSKDTTPEEFSAAIKTESASYASLLKLQTLLIVAKIMGLMNGRTHLQPVPRGEQTTITITDATKGPADFSIHYTDPVRAEWSCFINPETRNHLALLWSPVPGHIQVTARFSGKHIDRGVVEAALTKALSTDRLRV